MYWLVYKLYCMILMKQNSCAYNLLNLLTHYMGHKKTENCQVNIIAYPSTFINDVHRMSQTLIFLTDKFTVYIIGGDVICLLVVSACLQGSEVPSSI
jgi:hypothetical protein